MQEWALDSSYLEPGEYVVWKGKPEKGRVMDPQAMIMVPFGIVWTIFLPCRSGGTKMVVEALSSAKDITVVTGEDAGTPYIPCACWKTSRMWQAHSGH